MEQASSPTGSPCSTCGAAAAAAGTAPIRVASGRGRVLRDAASRQRAGETPLGCPSSAPHGGGTTVLKPRTLPDPRLPDSTAHTAGDRVKKQLNSWEIKEKGASLQIKTQESLDDLFSASLGCYH